MKQLFEDKHLTDLALRALFEGRLDNDQTLAAADHIANCACCAQKLADCAELNTVIPPRGFTEATLQRIADDQRKTQKAFYLYCARIAACAAIMIGIGVSGVLPTLERSMTPTPVKEASIPPKIEVREPEATQKFFQNIGDYFVDLKDSILNTEENTHDQTKK